MARSQAPGAASCSNACRSSGAGGNPVRSNDARRRSVRRSASGLIVRFVAANRAPTKASIGWGLACGPAGGVTEVSGRNGQPVKGWGFLESDGAGLPPGVVPAVPPEFGAISGPSYGAPLWIQSDRARTEASGRGSALAGMCGFSARETNRTSRLPGPSKRRTAGPSAPPFKRSSRVTRLKSPSTFSPPWHFRQWVISSGRMSRWNCSSPRVKRSAWSAGSGGAVAATTRSEPSAQGPGIRPRTRANPAENRAVEKGPLMGSGDAPTLGSGWLRMQPRRWSKRWSIFGIHFHRGFLITFVP